MLITKVADLFKQATEEDQANRLAQSRADIDYIAIMTGIDMDDDDEPETEAKNE